MLKEVFFKYLQTNDARRDTASKLKNVISYIFYAFDGIKKKKPGHFRIKFGETVLAAQQSNNLTNNHNYRYKKNWL